MLVAFFIVPGSLLASLAATVALVVVLSVLVATSPARALLALLGPNLDRWRIGARPPPRSARGLMALRHRRPAPPGSRSRSRSAPSSSSSPRPALALKTGPPSPTSCPRTTRPAQDSELLARSVGAGFEAPFVVVAATDNGPITEPDRLAALSRWQRRIAELPGVQAVVGPARVSRRGQPRCASRARRCSASGEDEPARQRRPGRPQPGAGDRRRRPGPRRHPRSRLRRRPARRGLGPGGGGRQRARPRPRPGDRAAPAAWSTRSEAFADGDRAPGRGPAAARPRAASCSRPASRTDPQPAPQRAAAARAACRSRSTRRRTGRCPRLQAPAQVADEQLKAALQQLEAMTVGKGDPNYAAALAAVRQALPRSAAPTRQRPALRRRIRRPAGRTGGAAGAAWSKTPSEAQQVTSWLVTGVHELKRLSSLAGRLSDAAQRLVAADRKLARGSGTAGERRRAGRRRHLAARRRRDRPRRRHRPAHRRHRSAQQSLGEGYGRSYPLQAGLRRATVRVARDRRLARTARRAPAPPHARASSTPATSSSRPSTAPRRRCATAPPKASTSNDSGQAATLLVFSRYALNSPGSIAFNKQLDDDAAALGREAGAHDRRRRRPRHAQRLQPRDQGADPAGRRRDHARHLPRPDPDPPLAAAGGDRGRPQPGDGRRRLRHPHDPHRRPRRLAARRPRLRRLGRGDDDLRDRLRALDRLRGLPPGADAGALRPRGRQPRPRSCSGSRRRRG